MKKTLLLLLLLILPTGCLQIKVAGANLPARFSSFDVERDVAYGKEEWQKLDVYTPDNELKKRPVIIFFYGGAWKEGEKSMYLFAAQPFADRGYVVIIPDYIKYPQGKFPQFLQDSAKAVAWARKNVSQFGGDKNKIFLMGHSAGGYISLMLADNPKYLQREGGKTSWIKAVAALAAPHDFDPTQYNLEGVFGKYRKEITIEPYIDRNDPPVLLLHGMKDKTVDYRQSKTLEKNIKNKGGKKVTAIYYPEADHRDLVAAMSIPLRGVAPVVDDVDNFFRGF